MLLSLTADKHEAVIANFFRKRFGISKMIFYDKRLYVFRLQEIKFALPCTS